MNGQLVEIDNNQTNKQSTQHHSLTMLSSLLRTGVVRQSVPRTVTLSRTLSSSYSSLEKVEQVVHTRRPNNNNSDDTLNKNRSQLQVALLQEMKRVSQEQKRVDDLISTIQSLKVGSVPSPPVPNNNQINRTDSDSGSSIVQLPDMIGEFQVMNRNARRPKRANHGKRPVSRIKRREKRRKWGNHRR